MLKYVLIILIQFSFIEMFSQSKLGNEWITGASGPRIQFNNGNVTSSHNHYILSYFRGGNSNICDTNGRLILASDGYNIYDSLGDYIEDGDTLVEKNFYILRAGSSLYSQTSIILPMDSSKYYLVIPSSTDYQYNECIQNSGSCYFDLLQYHLIDMNANGGAGKVVKRMQPLLENARMRKTQMMACRHANGKDWWLLKQIGDSANVHTFLFTQDSVYDKGVQVFSEPVWGIWDVTGQSTFNTNGTQYATTSQGGIGEIFLADFDRCYGKLSYPKVLQMPIKSLHDPNDTTIKDQDPTGLAFSPNGRFLYLAGRTNIFQFDLQDETWFHVAGIDTVWQKFQWYSTIYQSSDNKLYIGNYNGLSKQMSVINNPDVKGAGCNFCPRCLRLDSLVVPQGNYSAGTPPCMPNYSLGAKVCYPEATNDIEQEANGLVVYPNPSSTVFYIKNRKGKKKEMYNAVGQKIYSTTKEVIDVINLSKGVYFIKVEGEVKKVVVE